MLSAHKESLDDRLVAHTAGRRPTYPVHSGLGGFRGALLGMDFEDYPAEEVEFYYLLNGIDDKAHIGDEYSTSLGAYAGVHHYGPPGRRGAGVFRGKWRPPVGRSEVGSYVDAWALNLVVGRGDITGRIYEHLNASGLCLGPKRPMVEQLHKNIFAISPPPITASFAATKHHTYTSFHHVPNLEAGRRSRAVSIQQKRNTTNCQRNPAPAQQNHLTAPRIALMTADISQQRRRLYKVQIQIVPPHIHQGLQSNTRVVRIPSGSWQAIKQ
ncbi:hypothetical protein HOY80DRAFT_1102854 [Tuber brumale]|nr:hypothetical protein HOY80DRAFT_1102854 [Tuber brumale]